MVSRFIPDRTVSTDHLRAFTPVVFPLVSWVSQGGNDTGRRPVPFVSQLRQCPCRPNRYPGVTVHERFPEPAIRARSVRPPRAPLAISPPVRARHRFGATPIATCGRAPHTEAPSQSASASHWPLHRSWRTSFGHHTTVAVDQPSILPTGTSCAGIDLASFEHRHAESALHQLVTSAAIGCQSASPTTGMTAGGRAGRRLPTTQPGRNPHRGSRLKGEAPAADRACRG